MARKSKTYSRFETVGFVGFIIFAVGAVSLMIGLLGYLAFSPDMHIDLATNDIEYTKDTITFGIKSSYLKDITLYGVELKIYEKTFYCMFNSTDLVVSEYEIVFITAFHDFNISEAEFPYYELGINFIKNNNIKSAFVVRTNYWLSVS